MSANPVLSVHASSGDVLGVKTRDALFRRAGLRYLPAPEEPVRERQVGQLFDLLRQDHPAQARQIFDQAGEIAADVVVQYRIHAAARRLLRELPWPMAAWMMVRAAGQNAWTFGGSAKFHCESTGVFELQGNPTITNHAAPRPICHFHQALFENMFRKLVDPRLTCTELYCEGAGGAACRFKLEMPNPPSSRGN